MATANLFTGLQYILYSMKTTIRRKRIRDCLSALSSSSSSSYNFWCHTIRSKAPSPSPVLFILFPIQWCPHTQEQLQQTWLSTH